MFRFSRYRAPHPFWINLLACGLLSCSLGLGPALADAASPPSSAAAQQPPPSSAVIKQGKQTLAELQQQQDKIKQQITPNIDAAQLSTLNIKALSLVDQTSDLMAQLQSQQQQVQIGLSLLGPAPTHSAPAELPEIAARRALLQQNAADLDNLTKQIDQLRENGTQLSRNLLDLRN